MAQPQLGTDLIHCVDVDLQQSASAIFLVRSTITKLVSAAAGDKSEAGAEAEGGHS